MRFALDEIAGLGEIAALPAARPPHRPIWSTPCSKSAAKLAGEVLAPLNAVGDRERQPARERRGAHAAGLQAEAYARYRRGRLERAAVRAASMAARACRWRSRTAVLEMWTSANMAFALCPMLTHGAVELLHRRTARPSRSGSISTSWSPANGPAR